MSASPLELIVFDCDGVLVDSERLANEVLREMLAELGLCFSLAEMFALFKGRALADCLEMARERRGRPLPDGFGEELEHRWQAALDTHVQPMPGITEALDALDLPCCVASSGSMAKIRVSLGRTGLLSRFEPRGPRGRPAEPRIFSADDVRRPKPAPDVYLLAAKSLGVNPQRCGVIEDSAIGVRAGVAAGMRVFGFARETDARELQSAGAVATFAEMSALSSVLALHGIPSPGALDSARVRRARRASASIETPSG